MSLATDIIFVRAIKSNSSLLQQLDTHDVYNTSIALPDEDLDNAQLPYVVVKFDGMVNDISTKDSYEGDTDTVNIGIEVAAKTRSQLASLMDTIRTTVREYFMNLTDDDVYYGMVPLDYQLSADPVLYDSQKPCYWQVLHYQCDCRNDI